MEYQIEAVAGQQGISPKTLGNWVRQYQDEVDDLMVKKQNVNKQVQQDAAQFQDLQKKYEDAVMLLGEKELEIHVLQDLVKKAPRMEVAIHWIEQGYSVPTVLRICGVPRSTDLSPIKSGRSIDYGRIDLGVHATHG